MVKRANSRQAPRRRPGSDRSRGMRVPCPAPAAPNAKIARTHPYNRPATAPRIARIVSEPNVMRAPSNTVISASSRRPPHLAPGLLQNFGARAEIEAVATPVALILRSASTRAGRALARPAPHHEGREVLPIQHDGQIVIPISRISVRKSEILSCLVGQISGLTPPSPCPQKGTLRDRHGTLARLRWTRQCQGCFGAGREHSRVRRSRVVLAPRPWRQAGWISPTQPRGQERPLPRGEHEGNRQPIARGKPGCSGCTCGDYARVPSFHRRTRGCGCDQRPAFPAPSDPTEGQRDWHSSGEFESRE